MTATIVGNNMHFLVLDILTVTVLAYLIHKINESINKQGVHFALVDQALDIN